MNEQMNFIDWNSACKFIISDLRIFLQRLPIFIRIPIKLLIWGFSVWVGSILLLIQVFRFSVRVLLGGSVSQTASFTSVWVTQARFVGTLHKLCDDNLTLELLPFVSKLSILVRSLHSIATDKSHFLRPLDLNMSGRCTRGDQALLNLAPDITQIVILGAGNDTRLHRLVGLPEGLFEIDAPSTQAYKLQKLGKYRNPLVRFVSANFERESWLDNLVIAGFDLSKKTLFIWEGVTYYLTESALRSTLRSISQCATGSKLVLDYGVIERPIYGIYIGLWLFGKMGEPFRSLFTNESLLALMTEYRLVPDAPAVPSREAVRDRFASNEEFDCLVKEFLTNSQTVIDIKLITLTLT